MPISPTLVELDGWSPDGRNILAPECLAAMRQVLDKKGPVIVEHCCRRGVRIDSGRVAARNPGRAGG